MEKQSLCYPCALRMATLFKKDPPKNYEALRQEGSVVTVMDAVPLVIETHHPYFNIIYETAHSVRRYDEGKRPPLVSSTEKEDVDVDEEEEALTEGKKVTKQPRVLGKEYYKERREYFQNNRAERIRNSTVASLSGWPTLAGECRHRVSYLCVACYGLYQFLDTIHVPRVAAMVRTSRFVDSRAVSINVNINRSFTFTWLAAAMHYYDDSTPLGGEGHRAMPPDSMAVPEEYSSFKDFFMWDMRTRVMQFLNISHDELVKMEANLTKEDSGDPSPLPTHDKRRIGLPYYIASVHSLLDQEAKPQTDVDDSTGGEPPLKQHKREPHSTVPIPHALSYSPNAESIAVDVYCRYPPSEALVDSQTVPSTYCSNKPGVVLTFGVISEYVLPFLKEHKVYGIDTEEPSKEREEEEEAALVQCVVEHANVYLIGNYCKRMRYLSQSPWFTNGERIGTYSLQEIIANPILPFFFPEGVTPLPPAAYADQFAIARAQGKGEAETIHTIARRCLGRLPSGQASAWQTVDPALTSYERVFGYGRYKFHSAGREDVDVRMLGAGRPFVLEIVSPSREQFTSEDLLQLQQAVNESESGSVEVRSLRPTDSLVTVRLARHSESKVKRYRAVVWCSRAVPDPNEDPHFLAANQVKDLVVQQKTPLRVLHRRSLHDRPRTIHRLHLTPVNSHWFILEVETQAGTYVKEFVHGDMGRTVPSLGTLLNGVTDIIQLDVVDMAMQDLE